MFERMTSPPLPTGTGGEEGLIGPVALVLVDCSPTPRGHGREAFVPVFSPIAEKSGSFDLCRGLECGLRGPTHQGIQELKCLLTYSA